ncbi:cytochrome C peroxidase [Comamonas testosteroni TK102]|uniref:Cytochrome C peroxidase n=1 Tax=Comamonas testosteroni TK102 TaxID=1392005 RepID=A0A076PR36_COMTE|nr:MULTISPECIES: efflux RND transporter periplasmic adaptor subunit [Comamonas]AIJ49269.1 cytochrome C peroxidase [Comamonas testosteroni TK102]MPS89228.1 efflux RND transporter periplasmic adaptor subunit [Comamonas sp.]
MNSTSPKPRRTAIAIAIILALGAAAAAAIVYGTRPAAVEGQGHEHGAAEKGHSHEEKEHDHGSEAGHAEQSPGKGKAAAEADHADEEEGLLKLDAERARAAGVSLAEASPALIAGTLQLPGEIRFNEDRTAHVVPRVAGVAESVAANLGQLVKKGQLLATLTSPAVSEQRSELMAAQKRLALARTTYQREKQLWQEKISAEQDYLQAQQALREAEIASANAQQKLAAIGAGSGTAGALNRFELRAPFDGVVVEKHLAVGEAVQDSTAVFTISDLRSVWAEMKVAASDLPFVRVGEKATVHATAFESRATGVVAYVGALIGQETRTAPARITLDNPDGIWRPGLFVNVELTAAGQQAAVAVANAAIQKIDGDKPVVFVPVAGGFKAQAVKLGKADGQSTEVLQGLSTGQRYVKDGAFVLKSELGKATAEHVH